ncbi:hypothetical protein [Tengunoibacter tsumagoiensis]|uniref:Uncharacterized protein n=1 Tax=Tengunoibacter tsumagoiensis TaxID=2014871 RepID=A0A402A2E3_9CHLR|nr:hypothetical protein [Tengunoibacter tsumagoiensis]GCE13225.1 hypothetical protein KTT_30840 [Tengunoibacter tsumagoiensis]
MPDLLGAIHVSNFLGLLLFLVLWIVLCECARVGVMLLRREPLLGWAVSPFGVTALFLYEPSLLTLWLSVLVPACVSTGILAVALLSPFTPITFPAYPVGQWIVFLCAVLLSISGDLIHTLRDLRYPLWGEARVLRTMQALRSSWATIHFTPFGHSYVQDHFGSNPTELLQTM